MHFNICVWTNEVKGFPAWGQQFAFGHQQKGTSQIMRNLESKWSFYQRIMPNNYISKKYVLVQLSIIYYYNVISTLFVCVSVTLTPADEGLTWIKFGKPTYFLRAQPYLNLVLKFPVFLTLYCQKSTNRPVGYRKALPRVTKKFLYQSYYWEVAIKEVNVHNLCRNINHGRLWDNKLIRLQNAVKWANH